MRVLIDTNVILDFLLNREEFVEEARSLFKEVAYNRITAYCTATTLTNIFYISRRHTQSIEQARQAVVLVLSIMEICSVDRALLESALTSALTDFEDAVQVASALGEGLDAIVTRDAGLQSALIPVMSIRQILEQLEADK